MVRSKDGKSLALALLRSNRNFRLLITSDAISLAGSSISFIAVPLTAVVYLDASPAELGYLAAAGLMPQLLLGLPAGAWVDRLSYKNVLVWSNAVQSATTILIPVLFLLDRLTIGSLLVLTALGAVGSLFAAVAGQSLPPRLVARDDLMEANGLLVLTRSTTSAVGSGVGGTLVATLTAPIAIILDALSFAAAGITALRMRSPRTPRNHAAKLSLVRDIRAGLAELFGTRLLAWITVLATLGAIVGQVQTVLVVFLLYRDFDLTESTVAWALAAVALAGVGGALVAGPITRRFSPERSFLVGMAMPCLGGLMLGLVDSNWIALPVVVFVAQALRGIGPPIFGVCQQTFRMLLTAQELHGRVNASWRFLVYGTQALGAVLAGALAGLGADQILWTTSAFVLATIGLAAWIGPFKSSTRPPDASGARQQ